MWKCEVCGYIHRGPEPPETCPVCGAGREMFTRMEAVTTDERPVGVSSRRCSICGHVHEGGEAPAACPVCGAAGGLFEPLAPKALAAARPANVGRIVILGAGVAGLTAAEQARITSPDVSIRLVSKESRLPYYRLNLSRYLAGEVSRDSLTMQPAAWFSENRIDLAAGEAAAIDRRERQVRLRDGRPLPYDRLVLANGAHPFIPPIPGVTREGVTSFRTLADAEEILQRAIPGSRCVCVGGGLLGLETAGALAKRGAEVTVLEGHGWLLPRQLAEPAGRLLQRHVESLGLTVRCQAQVKEIVGDEDVRGVLLADGDEIPADLVALATGVRPNSHLARQSQIKVNGGVIVDDRMMTSDPAVLAAGDVAEHRGTLYGIWPAAYAQGVVAGINAAGGEAAFHGLPPANRLKVLDVDLFSIGQAHALDASFRVFEEERDGVYRRIVCRDGRIVGANLYGDTSLAGPIKEAIEAGTQILQLKEILARFPQLSAFQG